MNLTLIVIASIVVIAILFDFYIIAKKGKSESISAHVTRMSMKHPSIPFAVGFLCGHLFWSLNTANLYEDAKCFKTVNGQQVEIEK